ncbi:MAG: HEAT repeat domain-containing protein [Candidatus Glassbacteria bacterium]|nr:HEAT repeat domain-containing protein [Candidatus Glassbacteria bacterium]
MSEENEAGFEQSLEEEDTPVDEEVATDYSPSESEEDREESGLEFEQSPEETGRQDREPGKDEPGVAAPPELDLEKRIDLLKSQLKHLPNAKKIKPLKEMAYIGGLDSLRYILPLSRYSSEFVRKIARNSVIKIILRVLREDEGKSVLGIQQKKNLVGFLVGLDKKYVNLKNMELRSPKTTKQILDILIQEDINFTARTLAEIICDSDNKVRATAVKLIAEMIEEKETTLLVKLLNDPDSRVKANVIESLAALGNRNVVGILMKYKRDKDNRVRANALRSLWNLGYKDIEGSLREMLRDENPQMRSSAVWVIGEIGHKQTNFKEMLGLVEGDDDETVLESIKRAEKKILWREKGLRVLVIDDDKKFLQMFFKRLAGDGFHILAAFDGKAGVEVALKQRPDIIFLNLRIPLVNGLEVLRTLKSGENTRMIPVVVICDFNSSVLIKKASATGASDYLIKPFAYDQAKTKIQLLV